MEATIRYCKPVLARLILPLLEQYQEQLTDVKKEICSIYEEFITTDLQDDHALIAQHVELEKLHFDCSHVIKKLLGTI